MARIIQLPKPVLEVSLQAGGTLTANTTSISPAIISTETKCMEAGSVPPPTKFL